MTSSNAKAHRRSLKECLKAILPRRQDNHNHLTPTIEAKDGPSPLLLPTFGSLSTLRDFNSTKLDIDGYSVLGLEDDDSASDRNQTPRAFRRIVLASRSNLSLNQSVTQEAYQYQIGLASLAQRCSTVKDQRLDHDTEQHSPNATNIRSTRSVVLAPPKAGGVLPNSLNLLSPLSQLAHACNVPSIYRQGTSLQASLATLPSGIRSASTLRLQRSTQDLRSDTQQYADSPRQEVATDLCIDGYLPVKHPGQHDPRDCPSVNRPVNIPDVVSRSRRSVEESSEMASTLSSINHFSSFCVLDAATPGCPITAISADLREVLDIGEPFCLTNAAMGEIDMDTIAGQDPEGNIVVHLVVYNPLVNPSSGRSRFILAALLDITPLMTDSSPVPDLETISEESMVDEILSTPPPLLRRSHEPTLPQHSLSSGDLLEGYCSADELAHIFRPSKDDIWLDIAVEETRRSVKSVPGTPEFQSSALHSGDDILDQFLVSLRGLYFEFFLLGKSPLDESSYEICNVSPAVFERREYIEGHLTQTAPLDRAYLEKNLTQANNFNMAVRWGKEGILKQLYCIPLFGRSNVTWVCFLVDVELARSLDLD